ncbi:unnamed protein product [Boreogadus saida]
MDHPPPQTINPAPTSTRPALPRAEIQPPAQRPQLPQRRSVARSTAEMVCHAAGVLSFLGGAQKRSIMVCEEVLRPPAVSGDGSSPPQQFSSNLFKIGNTGPRRNPKQTLRITPPPGPPRSSGYPPRGPRRHPLKPDPRDSPTPLPLIAPRRSSEEGLLKRALPRHLRGPGRRRAQGSGWRSGLPPAAAGDTAERSDPSLPLWGPSTDGGAGGEPVANDCPAEGPGHRASSQCGGHLETGGRTLNVGKRQALFPL